MDLDAFKRGDMATLGRVVDELAPDAWRLARRGFVCTQESGRVHVEGMRRADGAEDLVIQALAALLTPEARAQLDQADALRQRFLIQLRTLYVEQARAAGREVGWPEETLPVGVEDLDRIIETGAAVGAEDPPVDPGVEQDAIAELAATQAFVEGLNERDREVVALRFRQDQTCEQIAAHFTCGAAAVRERERRIRRKLKHALAKRGRELPELGPAELDGLLGGNPIACTAKPVTLERIRSAVLTRTFQTAPAPFAQRAAWGLGFAAFSLVLFALMYVRVLPYYGDDRMPKPRVELDCSGKCRPGSEARVSVLAPQDARRVGLLLVGPGDATRPFLVDPAGSSLDLPFGAKVTAQRIAYPATLPSDIPVGLRVTVVAVFSDEELSAKELEDQVRRVRVLPGVLTSSTTIVL